MTTGPIERAVRAAVPAGTVLATPAQAAPFTVSIIDDRGLVLLLGAKEARTRFSWEAIEGVGTLLATGGWLPIGSAYSTDATAGTLDAYLKKHMHRATAPWIAALLEAAGVAEIDRTRPARIRLVPSS